MDINVTQQELQKRKLFLALPCYGGQCAGIYARSLMDLAVVFHHWGIPLQVYMLYNESLVTRARCYAADEFMRSDATHFMFIDSDIGFDARDVLKMLAMADPKSDFDVLCGPYPKKCISWEKVIQAVNKGVGEKDPTELDKYIGDFVFNLKRNTSFQINEPVEVLESGTGFMMIQRHVFENFKKAYPEYSYKPDHVRTKEFDGSREIMLYFQADIDRDTGENLFKEAIDAAVNKATTIEEAKKILAEAKEKYEHLNSTLSKRYLSEDYWFCQKIQKIGQKVWLCPWMKLQHFGSMTFGGSLSDLASIQASLTADPGALKKAS